MNIHSTIAAVAVTCLFIPIFHNNYKMRKLRNQSKFPNPEEKITDKQRNEHLSLLQMEKEHYGNRLRESLFALGEMNNALSNKEDDFKFELAQEIERRKNLTGQIEIQESENKIAKLNEKIIQYDKMVVQTNRSKFYSTSEIAALLKKA